MMMQTGKSLPYSLAKLAEYRKLYLEEARKEEAYS